MNITKKETDTDIENKPVVTTGAGGNMGAAEQEAQATGFKMDSRVYRATWGIQPIFCSSCKWKVPFKTVLKIKKYF